MSQSTNSSLALTVFVILTVIYIAVDYNALGSFSKKNLLIGYLGVVVVLEYGLNIVISESICKEAQPLSAFIATILSWVMIFIPIVYAVVYVMPGWLAPFANTFGHGVALLLKLDDVLDSLLIEPKDSGNSQEFKTTMARINSNRLILINEVTPDNFESFKTSMDAIFNHDSRDEKLKQLEHIVNVKYATAKFIWFILTGILASSMSYSYLLKTACNNSSSTAMKNRENHNRALKNEQE
jgi:hypothetical protein